MNLKFKQKIKQTLFKDDEMINEFVFKESKNCIETIVFSKFKGKAKVKYCKGFIKKPKLQLEFSLSNEQTLNQYIRFEKRNKHHINKFYEESVIKTLTDLIPTNTNLKFEGFVNSSNEPITALIKFTSYEANCIIKINKSRAKNSPNGYDPKGKIIVNVAFNTNYIEPVETKRDLKFEEKVIWALEEDNESYGKVLFNSFPTSINVGDGEYITIQKNPNLYQFVMNFNTTNSILDNKIQSELEKSQELKLDIPELYLQDLIHSALDQEILNHKFDYHYEIVGNEIHGSFKLNISTEIREFEIEKLEEEPGYSISLIYELNIHNE